MSPSAAALRRHGPLLLLVAADVATKLLAFALLPHDRMISVTGGLRLRLAVNDWGVLGGVQGMGRVTDNPAYTILLAAGLVLFSLAVLRLGSSSLGFGVRFALGTAAFVAVAVGAQVLAPLLDGVALPPHVVVPSIRGAALALAVALYLASRAAVPRVAFMLLAAGALANAASHAYPPFAVVDFLVVPIAPFLPLLAGRAAEASESLVGVVNLADLYVFAVPLVIAAWPLAALRRRVRGGLGQPGRTGLRRRENGE